MVLSLVLSAVGIAVTVALALGAVVSEALTAQAGAVAATFGGVIVVVAGFAFLALLVLFVVASVLATRYGIEEKERRNVQEGTHGERGVSNVLAHILIPTGLVAASVPPLMLLPTGALAVLFTAALAFGAADTFASELGVLAGRARSILTLRPVPAGTNGGVSVIGEAWALVGAVLTAFVGFVLFYAFSTPTPSEGLFFVVAAAAGFIGCQIDSLLGETLENRGWLTKGSTNLLAMALTVLIAALGLSLGGVPL